MKLVLSLLMRFLPLLIRMFSNRTILVFGLSMLPLMMPHPLSLSLLRSIRFHTAPMCKTLAGGAMSLLVKPLALRARANVLKLSKSSLRDQIPTAICLVRMPSRLRLMFPALVGKVPLATMSRLEPQVSLEPLRLLNQPQFRTGVSVQYLLSSALLSIWLAWMGL